MDISIFIAKALGIYLIILSTSIFIIKNDMRKIVEGIITNPSMRFMVGLMILPIGVLLVISHNLWDSTWHAMISLIGWLILMKGILYIAFPESIVKMAKPILKTGLFAYYAIVINFMLGVYFCYYGFFAT